MTTCEHCQALFTDDTRVVLGYCLTCAVAMLHGEEIKRKPEYYIHTDTSCRWPAVVMQRQPSGIGRAVALFQTVEHAERFLAILP